MKSRPSRHFPKPRRLGVSVGCADIRESLPAGREDRAAGGGGSIFKKGTLPPVKLLLVIVVLKGRVTKFKRRATPNNMSVSKKVNPTAEKCLNLEEYDRVSI